MTPEEMQKALDEKFKGFQTDLQDAQASGEASAAEIVKLTAEIEKSGNALEAFIASQQEKVIVGIEAQLKTFLKENETNIKDIHAGGKGFIDFVPKAVADVTTGSGTNATTPSALWFNELGGFNLRNDDGLISRATVSSTGSATYSYTEMLPKEGGYAFVAEGAAKPKIDFSWINRFADPKKGCGSRSINRRSSNGYCSFRGGCERLFSKAT